MSKTQEANHEAVSNVAKSYVKPAIVHELKLEARAGSPLSGINGLGDLLGVDAAPSE